MLLQLSILEQKHFHSIWGLCLRDPLLAEEVNRAAVAVLLSDVSIFEVNDGVPAIVLEPPHSSREADLVVACVASNQPPVLLLDLFNLGQIGLVVLSREDHLVRMFDLGGARGLGLFQGDGFEAHSALRRRERGIYQLIDAVLTTGLFRDQRNLGSNFALLSWLDLGLLQALVQVLILF